MPEQSREAETILAVLASFHDDLRQFTKELATEEDIRRLSAREREEQPWPAPEIRFAHEAPVRGAGVVRTSVEQALPDWMPRVAADLWEPAVCRPGQPRRGATYRSSPDYDWRPRRGVVVT